MSATGGVIAAKVEHVKSARNPGGHKCHWPGCDQEVKPALWGCRRHWYMLPARLRARIWESYLPGQEDTKNPSPEYLAVARDVQQWIRERTR